MGFDFLVQSYEQYKQFDEAAKKIIFGQILQNKSSTRPSETHESHWIVQENSNYFPQNIQHILYEIDDQIKYYD